MSLDDNKANLPTEYIEGIKRSHHGGLAERFIHGRFAAVGLGTIPFDSEVHVIRNIDMEILREVIYGVDFGWTNPSCILAVGYDGDKRAYVLDEFYQARVTHHDLVEEAKALMMRYGRGTFYCDPTEKQTIESFKSRGIRAVKNEAKRDEGIRELAGLFPLCGDGRAKIYISSQCVNLIAELQVYDEKVKEHDHAVDALRYAISSKMKKRPTGKNWTFGPVRAHSTYNPYRR